MNKIISQKARELRNDMTPQEQKLWGALRYKQLGFKFRRQQAIDRFIVDFCCFEKRLVVEVDGAVHLEKNQKEHDWERDKFLEENGFSVLRFWNDEVENDFLKVVGKIEACLGPHPHPPSAPDIPAPLPRNGGG